MVRYFLFPVLGEMKKKCLFLPPFPPRTQRNINRNVFLFSFYTRAPGKKKKKKTRTSVYVLFEK